MLFLSFLVQEMSLSVTFGASLFGPQFCNFLRPFRICYDLHYFGDSYARSGSVRNVWRASFRFPFGVLPLPDFGPHGQLRPWRAFWATRESISLRLGCWRGILAPTHATSQATSRTSLSCIAFFSVLDFDLLGCVAVFAVMRAHCGSATTWRTRFRQRRCCNTLALLCGAVGATLGLLLLCGFANALC